MSQSSELCKKCKGKAILHVGDRVGIGGNKTFFSHINLIQAAENRGLWVASEQTNAKLIVLNKNKATKKHYKVGMDRKIPIISPAEFEKMLSTVCDGLVKQIRKKSFKTLLQPGARIYPLGLDLREKKNCKD